jgi:hypothetical protein
LKFLKTYTPEQINQLCKEGKVEVEISVYAPEGEIIQVMDDATGNWVAQKREKLISQYGSTIRSWSDLFQIDDKYAMYLTDKEKQELL